ncbi:cytochrome c peroxidase [Catalinimonas sp. 4WD22]|uniref:cytochrome-c peroxidase n=1 Tax=Catalinimonas locisalis TaxID=3133978 RepID=UPI0031012BEA
MKAFSIASFYLLLCFLFACAADQNKTRLFTLDIPANFQWPMPVPEHNPTTVEGVALGKKLFYDPQLSVNNQISCASCHIPSLSFTDGQALSSEGVSGHQLDRHVPQLINVAWNDGLFWDGGAKNLESVVFGPITHPDEMGENLNQLVGELQRDASYPVLFKNAFDTDSIQSALIARALAQYMRTLVSADSPYDHYVRDEKGGKLTAVERQGMELVKEKCAACHAFEPGKNDFFTDFSYHNNGLDQFFSEDKERILMGRFRVTFDSTQIGAYKTPSLRNLAHTAPYMHDGRFQSLSEVLDHYATGVKDSPFLDSLFRKNGDKLGIPLSAQEKETILAFLMTLNDQTVVTD